MKGQKFQKVDFIIVFEVLIARNTHYFITYTNFPVLNHCVWVYAPWETKELRDTPFLKSPSSSLEVYNYFFFLSHEKKFPCKRMSFSSIGSSF